MVQQLFGKVAIVTGGASGIGRATALALADAGALLALVDVDAGRARGVVDEIEAAGGNARAFVADLLDVRAIDPVVDAVVGHFGHVDILVNSAGVTGGRHTVLDVPEDLIDQVLALNVRAPLLLIKHVGRHLVAQRSGKIVNVSSSAGFRSTIAPAHYGASKAAVAQLTRSAAADLGPYDINVNAVAPGVTRTPLMSELPDAELQRLVEEGPLANLLRRPSEAEDVANVIVFLCLPASRQITGQTIHTSAGLVV